MLTCYHLYGSFISKNYFNISLKYETYIVCLSLCSKKKEVYHNECVRGKSPEVADFDYSF